MEQDLSEGDKHEEMKDVKSRKNQRKDFRKENGNYTNPKEKISNKNEKNSISPKENKFQGWRKTLQ